jgi:type I restriction enzyme M protein
MVFDEETQAALKESGGDADFAAYPENHRFQIPSEAHWRNLRQAAKNVGRALQSAMCAIETANPDKLYGIFGDAQWTNKDRLSDAMLRDLVEHFSLIPPVARAECFSPASPTSAVRDWSGGMSVFTGRSGT